MAGAHPTHLAMAANGGGEWLLCLARQLDTAAAAVAAAGSQAPPRATQAHESARKRKRLVSAVLTASGMGRLPRRS
jgi:hypothetical protein